MKNHFQVCFSNLLERKILIKDITEENKENRQEIEVRKKKTFQLSIITGLSMLSHLNRSNFISSEMINKTITISEDMKNIKLIDDILFNCFLQWWLHQ
jgi:hypothetical protein